MFRNIVAPVQAWLMSQGRCVACGQKLNDKGYMHINGEIVTICGKCGRIYLYEPEKKRFRRAPIGTKYEK